MSGFMFAKEVFQQKTVGCMMVMGLVVFLCSGMLLIPFGFGGVLRGTYTREDVTDRITDAGTLNLMPITFAVMMIGVVMMLGGLFYGLWVANSENSGPRKVVEHFRIIARYAYDKQGYHLVDDGMIEFADRPRFYVRALKPNGETLEYEASELVWRQMGEGMSGEAELQGKWVGRFVPYVGLPPEDS